MMNLTTVNFTLLKEEVQNCFYHDIYKLRAKLYLNLALHVLTSLGKHPTFLLTPDPRNF